MKKVFKSKAYKDKLKGHKDGVIKICAPHGPESGLLLSASKDGCIRAWDLIERKITIKLHLNRDGDDSSQMYQRDDDNESGDEDDGNKNYLSKQKSQEMKKSIDSFTAVCFTENQVFGGYEDGFMYSWNLKEGHTGAISEMEFLNTRLIVTSSLDQTIRVWDASVRYQQIYNKYNLIQLSSINDLLCKLSRFKNNLIDKFSNKGDRW